ncbi:MAG TPA: hypothetical protein VLA93_10020 [Pyrinomonadaceae bacterium]|nr:hypothetical protein [Pyrinomonadaceae bacterium]
MKRSFLIVPLSALAVLCASWQALSQTADPQKMVRPRTVAAANHQQTTAQTGPKDPQPAPAVEAPTRVDVTKPTVQTTLPTPATAGNITPLILSPTMIQSRISEAKRLFKTRPQLTAMTSPQIQFVNIAALDRKTSHIHVATVAKQTFLTKGSEITMTSSLGEPLTIRVIRANGVNTALSVFTQDGRSLDPLVVEFPIEKGGTFKELAYYTSAHPALLSKDLTMSGQAYIRNMLDLAAKRLRDKGVFISNDLIDIAERLCVVEHVDHDRFRNENRLALYDEIYSLYALNEIDTYRYSVSSAGAGGMVQMIPWAYNLIRQRHPGVGLIPDFVTGMRNHSNALQAMLLYMNDTWNDLAANDEVKYAMNAKLATMSELMAAGYNSNAAKLPTYLRRGGQDWKVLIPRETQMYLQIYKSFEALVPIKTRTTTAVQTD